MLTEAGPALNHLWRRDCPEALVERSARWIPLVRLGTGPDGAEQWENDRYTVVVWRGQPDPIFKSAAGLTQIGITSIDGTARHDWRDFQAIKNQIAGGESEAFELFPAESRLLDPCNYYVLWAFPGVRIPVGTMVRRVCTAAEAVAPQRAFPHEPVQGGELRRR